MSSVEGAGAGKVVCVTGRSGFASLLVKSLLARGYTVVTVRDTAGPNKTLHLRALDGAKDRLHLFKASLLEEGTFDAAIEGCEYVFHTASPFYHNVKDPEAELLDPAVKGTLHILNSCKKASIKRVVVTLSMAAVAYNEKPRTPDVVVDEKWFSVSEVCEKNQQWYVLSKTVAEEAAWNFSKENGFEVVTIYPTMVTGPLRQPTLNTSAEAILKLIDGKRATPVSEAQLPRSLRILEGNAGFKANSGGSLKTGASPAAKLPRPRAHRKNTATSALFVADDLASNQSVIKSFVAKVKDAAVPSDFKEHLFANDDAVAAVTKPTPLELIQASVAPFLWYPSCGGYHLEALEPTD